MPVGPGTGPIATNARSGRLGSTLPHRVLIPPGLRRADPARREQRRLHGVKPAPTFPGIFGIGWITAWIINNFGESQEESAHHELQEEQHGTELFKYQRAEFGLDTLPEHALVEVDEDAWVVNPA